MKKILAMAAAIPLSTALVIGCAEPQPEATTISEGQVAQWKAELMEADRVFAETIGREGLSRWGSFFADDGAVIQEGVGEIRGVENIQANMDAGAAAVTGFTWAPERASVSSGGDLGYTVGRFRTRILDPDGVELERTGLYVSVWRRQEDGSWKVEMDLGNPLTQLTPVSEGTSGSDPAVPSP